MLNLGASFIFSVICKVSLSLIREGWLCLWYDEMWAQNIGEKTIDLPKLSTSMFFFLSSLISMANSFRKIDLDQPLFLKGKLLSPLIPCVTKSGWFKKIFIFENSRASSIFPLLKLLFWEHVTAGRVLRKLKKFCH